jgi:60 kDa SS-A/Ro ribonucleoprotein
LCANPGLTNDIIAAMLKKVGQTILPGYTVLVVDVSGSMGQGMSGKSKMNRMDGATALAMLLKAACEKITIYATAGNDYARTHATERVGDYTGQELRQRIVQTRRNIGGGGIFVVQVMDYVARQELASPKPDRVIIITDEQDCDVRSATADKAKRIAKHNYILNVAPEKYGVVTGGLWTRISGFTEHVIDFILEEEQHPLFN